MSKLKEIETIRKQIEDGSEKDNEVDALSFGVMFLDKKHLKT